ncbi:mechanosensitive ion channel family protein [uncultured Algimonas sp.]|uniref:mechanosensitive ion channel family protein n=1 Tax=uncultured Algimonas sp. TaxID=1547920 RepID=UPI00261EC1AE|nr:mechanosensitive ion channel family protein [uncultured Algimonas sp.]
MRPLHYIAALVLALLYVLIPPTVSWAQDAPADVAPITVQSGPTDRQIQARIADILSKMTDTQSVAIGVDGSVVTLSGEAPNTEAAERAVGIAERVDGVVAVQDEIVRTLDVSDNVTPLVDRTAELSTQFVRALPLIAAALTALVAIYLLGRFLAGRKRLLERMAGNPFLAELIATAIRIAFVLIGIVVALNILGATGLVGTVLGGAGIIGIALGFGVRDTVENYVASLLLSIRQPFRAEDHVVIDGQEGIVVRLNTRATILMTLDGNHLRIPNAKVFKADILNYTTNPTRRFGFRVGVDSADDPVAAIAVGTQAMAELPFVLADPPPAGRIVEVGDSSILIDYMAWIDQRETGFFSARSQAIRDVKTVLEDQGFSLPEPLYRVRVDTGSAPPVPADKPAKARPVPEAMLAEALDTNAEFTIIEHMAEERKIAEAAGRTGPDLLDDDAPQE